MGKDLTAQQIYEQTAGFLTAVCSRYVADKDALRDVLHDVYVKAFSNMDKFEYRGEGSLRAWLSRIAVNESVSYLRRSRRLVFTDEIPDAPDETPPDISGMDAGTIMKAIEQLPPGYRTVLNLFLIEGRSHKEIASLLGIAEKSSSSQYHRARTALARILKDKLQ